MASKQYPFLPHFAGHEPSVMGVVGTLGTADTGGTANILPIGVNPNTGAMYVQNLSGTVVASNVEKGTLSTVGTLGSVTNIGQVHNAGTIQALPQVSVGTIPQVSVGTIPNVNVATGTQQTLGTVGVVNNVVKGTVTLLEGGTLGEVTSVTTVSNLTNGTTRISLGSVGGVDANAAAQTARPIGVGGTDAGGTIRTINVDADGAVKVVGASAGTVVEVNKGTINVLALGTIGGKAASGAAAVANPVQIAGTDSGGTIYSPLVTSAGALTVTGASAGTFVNIVTGTQQTLGTVGTLNGIAAGDNNIGNVDIVTGTLQSSGTTTGIGVVSNLTNGSVNLLTGTVTSVANLAAGTVQLNPVPVPATLQFGTLGTAGGSFFGTLSAASGAGTKHYITGVDIVINTGTADVRVLAGTSIQGTGVLAAGNFPAGGGISKRITPAFATGTNSELVYHFVGAGSAFINISYWKGV